MTDVFLCEKGQLTAASKKALREASVVVAEVTDLSKCQFIKSSEVVSHDDMLWAVLDAINVDAGYSKDGAKQREQVAKNLLQIVAAARMPEQVTT